MRLVLAHLLPWQSPESAEESKMLSPSEGVCQCIHLERRGGKGRGGRGEGSPHKMYGLYRYIDRKIDDIMIGPIFYSLASFRCQCEHS